jgi:hypothetical protein
MSRSIGIVALKNKLESTLADLVCRKHDYLCLGKCVNDINYNLMKMYNWWWLLYQGDITLTDKEINCINDSIPNMINYPVIPVAEVPAIVPPPPNELPPIPEPEVEPLTCSFQDNFGSVVQASTFDKESYYALCTSCNGQTRYSYNYDYNGVVEFIFGVQGGVAPYTYSAEMLYSEFDYNKACGGGCPYGNQGNIDNATFSFEDAELSGLKKLVINNVNSNEMIKVKITTTDSDGRTTTCTVERGYFYVRS